MRISCKKVEMIWSRCKSMFFLSFFSFYSFYPPELPPTSASPSSSNSTKHFASFGKSGLQSAPIRNGWMSVRNSTNKSERMLRKKTEECKPMAGVYRQRSLSKATIICLGPHHQHRVLMMAQLKEGLREQAEGDRPYQFLCPYIVDLWWKKSLEWR